MIEFRTLGAVDLRHDDGRSIAPVSSHAKRISLLAYLCASSAPALRRRDGLIALLWPDLDAAHARGALRQELYQLRRNLGPDVLVGERDEAVGVDGERLWCDAAAFEAAVESDRPADALQLWHGEFLPGLHVDGGEFERWVDEKRARLSRLAMDAARTLLARAEAAGDLATAVSWARRVTELAPYDETGWRQLIDLLNRRGDRADALKAFGLLAARLHDDLEVEPSPETIAMIEQIRGRNEAFATGSVNGEHYAPSHRPSRTVIELVPVINETGDATLDALSRRLGDRLADALIAHPFIELVTGGHCKRAAAAISAALCKHGDQVEVRARLVEVGEGSRVLAVTPSVLLAPGARDEALDTITAHVLVAAATRYDPRVVAADGATPFKTPSWPGFLEYLHGSELFGERHFAEAPAHFLKAYELDPDFAKAAIFGGIALCYAGQPERADSLATSAMSGMSLPDYERYFGEWFLADLHGRRPAAYRAAREVIRVTDHPVMRMIAGREAFRMRRLREALQVLPDLRGGPGWWENWTELGEAVGAALHALGDHQTELSSVREVRVRLPESFELMRAEARARSALGQSDEVLALVTEALTIPPSPSLTMPSGEITPANLGWTAAQELEAHGQEEAASRARRVALQWLAHRENRSRADRLLEIRLLLESGAVDEACQRLTKLEPMQDLEGLGLAGLVAGARGDAAGSREALTALERLQYPYLRGQHLLLAAGIRAALNEPDLAVDTLRRAFAAGLPFDGELHALPMFRPLSSREDFAELLRPRG